MIWGIYRIAFKHALTWLQSYEIWFVHDPGVGSQLLYMCTILFLNKFKIW